MAFFERLRIILCAACLILPVMPAIGSGIYSNADSIIGEANGTPL